MTNYDTVYELQLLQQLELAMFSASRVMVK